MVTELNELQLQGVSLVRWESAPTFTLGGDSPSGPSETFVVEQGSDQPTLETVRKEDLQVGGRSPLEQMASLAAGYRNRAAHLDSSAAAWSQAGFAYLAAQDLNNARTCFESALNIDPSSRTARLGLARTAHEEGDFDGALTVLSGLLEENSDDLEPRVNKAIVLATQGKLQEALRVIEQDVPATREYASLLATRGGIYFGLRAFPKAVSDLRKVVRLKPEWVHVRNLIGLAELKEGKLAAAEKRFQEALRIGPFSLAPLLNLLGLLRLQQRWHEVIHAIERFWTPSVAPVQIVRYAAEAFFELDDARSARNWLQGAESRARDDDERASLLNNLGVAHFRLDRLDEASRAFAESVTILPSESSVANAAQVLLSQGRAEQAVDWLLSWQNRPDLWGSELRGSLAYGLALLRRHEEAIVLARELIAAPDADEEAFNLLTILYTDGVGNHQAAIDTALLGLSKWPHSVRLINNLSYALLQDNQVDLAEQYLRTVDLGNVDRTRRTHLLATTGLFLLKKGNIVDGRRLYEEAVALAPRESLREKVKAKRDLEIGRTIIRLGGSEQEATALLVRAAESGPASQPYNEHARNELRAISSRTRLAL